MYNPRWFKEERVDVLQDEVEKISFGTLITNGSTQILASHVPMLIDRSRGASGTLYGHIARGNSQWRDTKEGSDGLAIFLGPDAYISPSWYKTKAETGKVVPTWNYITVQVRGPIVFFDDQRRLERIVTQLTNHHETGSKDPWRVDYAPADYIKAELKSIIGFEMSIVSIEGKWKLGQNRTQADREGAMQGLEERGARQDGAVSEAMRSRSPYSQDA